MIRKSVAEKQAPAPPDRQQIRVASGSNSDQNQITSEWCLTQSRAKRPIVLLYCNYSTSVQNCTGGSLLYRNVMLSHFT